MPSHLLSRLGQISRERTHGEDRIIHGLPKALTAILNHLAHPSGPPRLKLKLGKVTNVKAGGVEFVTKSYAVGYSQGPEPRGQLPG